MFKKKFIEKTLELFNLDDYHSSLFKRNAKKIPHQHFKIVNDIFIERNVDYMAWFNLVNYKIEIQPNLLENKIIDDGRFNFLVVFHELGHGVHFYYYPKFYRKPYPEKTYIDNYVIKDSWELFAEAYLRFVCEEANYYLNTTFNILDNKIKKKVLNVFDKKDIK
jgi:hypothetical protein